MKRIGFLMMAALMAKDEPGGTKGRKSGGGSPDAEPAPQSSSDADWAKVETNRPFYFAETCRSTPLQGYLLNIEDMPPSDLGAWSAYSIKTTADCLAVLQGEDDSDTPVMVPAGTEVLVKATIQLKRSLSRYLVASSIMEVRITPLTLEKRPGARTMWTYDVRMNPRTVKPRPAMYPLVAPSARRRPIEDDIPF